MELGTLSTAILEEPLDQLALKQTWMTNCLTGYTKCKQVAGGALPKRLLDVKAFQISGVKKVPPTSEYVALSHCWGPVSKHLTCTTKATQQDKNGTN